MVLNFRRMKIKVGFLVFVTQRKKSLQHINSNVLVQRL